MSWRLTITTIFLISGVLSGWYGFNGHPALPQVEAASSPARDIAAFGFIYAQVATTPAAAAPTPTPAPPTPTPVPPTPTPAPTPPNANTGSGLPVVPVFLGIMFLGLVLAVSLPLIRSRFGRR
jgi:hypothetical protein